MTDKVTDTSRKEQLGLVLRYTIGNNVAERLFEYVDCKSITGESVCRKIVSILESAQLSVSDCQAQTYNGAGNMAGQEVVRHVSSSLLTKHCIFTVPLMTSTLHCQKLAILVIYKTCLML